jgi:hypothetical protein
LKAALKARFNSRIQIVPEQGHEQKEDAQLPAKVAFRQGRRLTSIRFTNVPKVGATNPNYEKITLHFSQRSASRSLRTKRNRGRSGEFARACENGKEHHNRESAGNDGEDQGKHKHDDEHQYDDGFDSEFVELDQHDDDDFEPEPVVVGTDELRKASRVHSREAFLFAFLLMLVIMILILPERSGARSGS